MTHNYSWMVSRSCVAGRVPVTRVIYIEHSGGAILSASCDMPDLHLWLHGAMTPTMLSSMTDVVHYVSCLMGCSVCVSHSCPRCQAISAHVAQSWQALEGPLPAV